MTSAISLKSNRLPAETHFHIATYRQHNISTIQAASLHITATANITMQNDLSTATVDKWQELLMYSHTNMATASMHCSTPKFPAHTIQAVTATQPDSMHSNCVTTSQHHALWQGAHQHGQRLQDIVCQVITCSSLSIGICKLMHTLQAMHHCFAHAHTACLYLHPFYMHTACLSPSLKLSVYTS